MPAPFLPVQEVYGILGVKSGRHGQGVFINLEVSGVMGNVAALFGVADAHKGDEGIASFTALCDLLFL